MSEREPKLITRRKFLVGAAAVLAGVAGVNTFLGLRNVVETPPKEGASAEGFGESETPTVEATKVIQAPTYTPRSEETAIVTSTVAPKETSTPIPSNTPRPTETPRPTNTPIPTHTFTSTPEATSTPVEKENKEQLLTHVDKVIDLVENPDPVLKAKYISETDKQFGKGTGEESFKNGNLIVVSGGDPKHPESLDPVSLRGIQEAINQGNNDLARERVKELVLSNNLIAPNIGILGKEDAIVWKKIDIDKYDPERKVIDKQDSFFLHSNFREQAIIELFELYYAIP